MRTGLTLRHEPPRRPAWYGASSALTITPSWPAASASAANASARQRVVGPHGREAQVGGDVVEHAQPLLQRPVEQVVTVDVEHVEEEGLQPRPGHARARLVPAEAS